MAHRGGFSNRLGFVLAAAGSAVGLGNIWKFPFEVGQGGGAAFVAMYLLFCFILAFPVMVTEIAIGRKTQLNPAGAYTALGFKKWRGLGVLGILCGTLILSYYNVVAGWAFGYFVEMILGNFDIGSRFGEFTKDIVTVGGYAVIFMLITTFIVSRGVSGGIERAAKILMPTLIAMILGLVIYAMTLPNAMKGVEFYLVPDFSAINLKTIRSALGQAFFSLSLGMGAIITYGSYVNKNENILASAALITLADVGIAFLAGLMLFPFVFSQGLDTNGGPGLIFITLPGVFESLGGNLGVLIGGAFFLLLSFAALTSTVSLLEVPVSYAVDEHKLERRKAVWLMALIIFIIGLPSLMSNGYSKMLTGFITYVGADSATDFMTFVGHIANDTFLPIGGVLITLFAAYVWKKENLNKELEAGYPNFKGSFAEKYVDLGVRFICPLVLSILVIMSVLETFFGVEIF